MYGDVFYSFVSYLCMFVLTPLSSVYCGGVVVTELCVLIRVLWVVVSCTNQLDRKSG
jgi:hypothetical protein